MLENKDRPCVVFGNAVREFRRSQGFSQEEFADRVGIHRTYIGGIERGERNPTLTTIYKIAIALDIRPGDLLPSQKTK